LVLFSRSFNVLNSSTSKGSFVLSI
jgi:hypothetical protein